MIKCTIRRFVLLILLIQAPRVYTTTGNPKPNIDGALEDDQSEKRQNPDTPSPSRTLAATPLTTNTQEQPSNEYEATISGDIAASKTNAAFKMGIQSNEDDTPPLPSVSPTLSSSYSIPEHGDAQIRTIRKQSNGIRTKSLPPVVVTARADTIVPEENLKVKVEEHQKSVDSGEGGSNRKETVRNELDDMLSSCVSLEDVVIYIFTGLILIICVIGYYLFQINIQRGKTMNIMEKKDRDLCRLQDELEECKDKLKSGREEIERAIQAKKEALSRLEKAACQGLKKDTGITDLRTENRPTKIAEAYRELYDNEWTEAVCEMTDSDISEKDAIAFLLKGLFDAYKFSRDMYEQRLGMLGSVVMFPESKTAPEEKDNTEALDLPNDCEHLLRELMKSSACCVLDSLKKEYIKTFHEKNEKYTTAVIQYLKKCAEVTWFMNVQRPPMTIEEGTSHGSAFDSAYYTCYTVQGTQTDFLVWPLSRVEEGGVVLSKGVVQPIKVKKEG